MACNGAFAVADRRGSWGTFATVCVFLALFLVSAFPAPARATTLEKMTIEQMSRRATTIVEGTVVSTAVEQSPYGVRTAVRLQVNDCLKGSAAALQTLYVPGGTLPDGTRVVVDGMASFSPGQSCYVFIDQRGWVMGGFQGKVSVQQGNVIGSGETMASMSRRVRAALDSVDPGTPAPPPPVPTSTAVSTGEAGWFKQTSGSKAYLYGVDFSDSAHGWAVGYDPSAWPGEVGTILATTNGGATWSAQSSGTMQSLSSVAFADAANGWAVGGRDIILATTNGGATWVTQRPSRPTGDPVWAVDFSDATHGWVVGRWAAFTADGGATWHDSPASNGLIGYGWGLHGIDFSDVAHGWAVGENGSIFATTDGGASWTAQTSGTTVNLQGVAFSDARHGWAVGYGSTGTATIVATTDGGAHWVTQWSESTRAPLLVGVAFSDALHGWAVGRNDNGTSAILATANGGTTWSAQTSGSVGELFSVSCSDAYHCWAVGENGAILATTNGGWSPEPGAPTISSISPGEASAGTDTHVTIAGTNFGSKRGKVEFSYGREGVMRVSAGDILSWTDTSINCAVPVATIAAYTASAGSGPVVVTTATGKESNPRDFLVPFGYGGSRWGSPGLTYWVNTSGIDDALRESLVDAAATQWNGAGSTFRFTDGGTTSAGAANDGFNVLSWAADLPAGVIARATSYINDGTVTQCDVVFNTAYSWGDGASGSNTMDIQSVTMHEVGHWLRLLDQYMPADSSKIMYGFGAKNQQRRTLTAGDIAGIRWIYPAVSPTPTVMLKLSGLTGGVMKVGKRVTATGRVSPTSLGIRTVALTVQLKSGSKWIATKATTAVISPMGAYSWKYTPAKKGAYRIRATIGKTAVHTAAATKWYTFTAK